MSTWYNKVVGDLGTIVDSITYFEMNYKKPGSSAG